MEAGSNGENCTSGVIKESAHAGWFLKSISEPLGVIWLMIFAHISLAYVLRGSMGGLNVTDMTFLHFQHGFER